MNRRILITAFAAAGLALDETQALLDSLARRRLVRRDHDCYCPLGEAA